MFTAYVVVTFLTDVANTAAAIVDFRRPQWVLDNIATYGATHSWLYTLGAIKAAAPLGLLIGIGVPPIVVAASTGLVPYFLGAILGVVRAECYSHLAWPS